MSLVRKNFRKDILLYLILAVPVIQVFIFSYIPMAGNIIAFQDYNIVDGFLHSKWVGLKWFTGFISDDSFFRLIRNTLLLSIYGLLWSFPAPIILALLLNEVKSKLFKKTVQTISYLPYFISSVVAVGMIFQILSPSTGVVNIFLSKVFGIEPILFMADPKWFRTIYIASGIWQGAGYSSILYLAALTNIDTELYEAAVMDGAGRFAKMKYVTIPGIMPTIIVLFLLSVGSILFTGFEKVILMYNPLIADTAEVIDSYVYRRGLVGLDFSYSTAVGLFQSIISFVLVIAANKISRKMADISLW